LGATLLLMVLTACGSRGTPELRLTSTPSPSTSTPQVEASPTPVPPSPTPIPLAATVNDIPITLEDYQTYQALFQAAQAEVGTNLATEEGVDPVLEDLIDQVLLAEAAENAGFTVDDALLDARIQELVRAKGGEDGLTAWLEEQGYTEVRFRRDLARAVAAAWMRDQIVSEVPETAEQVHARQILLYNSEDAQQVLDRIRSGADFANLAVTYDPQGFGDLGWFPRGYLTETAIEMAAFSLQPGEVSEIIETRLGFHILQVVDRRSDRPLDPDALLTLQLKTLRRWLSERKEASEIQVLLP
jgi:parvulin-like peptidyl-prolyl isomerase